MSFVQPPVGIAILCDTNGTILHVIQDGIGVVGLLPGQPLEKMVDSGSRIKLLNFLVELRGKGAAFDWEINIQNQGQVITLRLAGALGNDSFMIVGARTPNEALYLCDELMMINNEQATALRAAIKGQMQNTRDQNDADGVLYDEISRLNNELITLQRDLAKKNAELERLYIEVQKQSITDQLTGVYNRRGFFEISEREIERAKRYNRPLAAIMFDLDHFKIVNDTYGHAVGDQVLKEIAALCTQKLRKTDIFGRYGGEEFSILLPETLPTAARLISERLRQAVAQPLNIGKNQLHVTISLGVAPLNDNITDLQDLLESADRAMYKAKESGRNRTYIDL
ncbi:MAG: GGDEF domain-containing protein [Anaerolineaceae bacterium]|nr:GGDEF domain-containing protein [Anaerolineaceae bacterium]NTV35406.1 GGDEF domain-containing protein [Anaerolineaceae bacterium]